ncbi:hypothetical protein [Demequina soli]|uniref:hypothetical protein n=1 Tax=Demequina soli TaxID=1638987 RepID=UPI00078575B6|nr:hypothetical protein [Demequina soli]
MPSGRRSSKRPYGQPHQELDVDRVWGNRARIETGPRGEDFYVAIPRPTDRTFVCPGCQGEISGEVQHVVAWPVDGIMGADAAAESRRHWHTGCWQSFGRAR